MAQIRTAQVVSANVLPAKPKYIVLPGAAFVAGPSCFSVIPRQQMRSRSVPLKFREGRSPTAEYPQATHEHYRISAVHCTTTTSPSHYYIASRAGIQLPASPYIGYKVMLPVKAAATTLHRGSRIQASPYILQTPHWPPAADAPPALAALTPTSVALEAEVSLVDSVQEQPHQASAAVACNGQTGEAQSCIEVETTEVAKPAIILKCEAKTAKTHVVVKPHCCVGVFQLLKVMRKDKAKQCGSGHAGIIAHV